MIAPLTVLWLAPAAAAALVLAMPGRRSARWTALLSSGIVLAYALWLIVPFSAETGSLRLLAAGPTGPLGIRYSLAVDGLSLPLLWLTALLTALSLAASWKSETPPAFWACFLALEAALMGVFCSRDLFYFYVFWDLALIPMFFIIGLWGSDGRRKASFKFFLYTFLGSLALLLGLAALTALHHRATGIWTWDMAELARSPGPGAAASWVFAALALGFAVKIPVFPLHNWLPDAHTEAPAGGSVMLAGAMLKMGVFGFLRVLLPIFPELSARALPLLGGLGVVNILYGAFCAMAQKDLKRLVAFTSVSHMGFCLLGLASLTEAGLTGAGLHMLNHGLSTGGLFLLVGMLYERTHRRGLDDFGAISSRAPALAAFFAFILLSSIGLPGLNGFVGEVLVLIGAARASFPLAVLGSLGAVLAAAYGLPAFQKVFWGPEGTGSVSSRVSDLDLRERTTLWTLCALILWLGLAPGPVIDLVGPALGGLVQR